jgi:DNA polymerase elongation subunit (family B)
MTSTIKESSHDAKESLHDAKDSKIQVKSIDPVLYNDWKNKTFHNPTYDQLPPAWTQASEAKQRLSTASSWDVYLTEIREYRSQLILFGVTSHAENVSMIVSDFCPFMYVQAPPIATEEGAIPIDTLVHLWNKKFAEVNHARFTRSPGKKKSSRLGDNSKRGDDMDTDDEDEKDDNRFKTYLEPSLQPILSAELVHRRVAPIYHSRKQPFLLLKFRHIEDLNNTKQFFARHRLPSGDPNGQLRTIRTFHESWTLAEQFRMSCGVRQFGWITVDRSGVMADPSLIDVETSSHLTCTVKASAIRFNKSNARPPMVWNCFDIECIAKQEMDEVEKTMRGEKRNSITFFPSAKLPGDICTTIGTQFYLLGQEPLLRVVHQLKTARVEKKDVLTYTFDTESDMINHWIYMNRRHFDVMGFTGFNTITFDMPYIMERCIQLSLAQAPYLSRLYNDCKYVKILEKSGGSKQKGDMKVNYCDLPGIIQFDAYIAAKAREKCDSYSLKELAKTFLKGPDSQKDDLDYKHHGPYFLDADPRKRGILAEYCEQDVQTTRKLIYTRGWMDLYLQVGFVTFTEMMDLMLRGTTIQTWHLIQNKAYEDGCVFNEEKRLLLQWLHNGNGYGKLLEKLVKMGHSEDDLYTLRRNYRSKDPPPADMFGASSWKGKKNTTAAGSSGSSGSASSADLASKNSPPKPSCLTWNPKANQGARKYQTQQRQEERRTKKVDSEYSEKYDGGYVHEAKKGFYRVPICTLDFASLYPTVMQARRLCLSTFLPCKPGTHEPDMSTVDPNDKIVIESIHDGRFTTHWVQSTNGQPVWSIIPALEDELVSVRREVKKILQTCDESEKSKYSMHELALKVCANGMYGALASVFMLGSLRPISMATCAFGRLSTKSVIEYVETVEKLSIIYGDTDSIFILIPEDRVQWEKVPDNPQQEYLNKWSAIFAFAKQVAARVNQNVKVLRAPMKMEFEKIMYPYLQIIKKCYAGMILNEEPPFDPKKLYMRGFPTVRRDYCPAVRNHLTDALKVLFKYWDPERLLHDLRAFCERFAKKQLSYEELVTTVQIKAKYGPDAKLRQVVLKKKLESRGIHVSPGTRIPFMMIRPPAHVNLKHLKARDYVEHDDYVREHKLTPWYAYYLQKQLQTFMCKILVPFNKDQDVVRIISSAVARCDGKMSIMSMCSK